MTNPLQAQITPLESALKKIQKIGTPVVMLEKRERFELTLHIETLEAQIARLQKQNSELRNAARGRIVNPQPFYMVVEEVE